MKNLALILCVLCAKALAQELSPAGTHRAPKVVAVKEFTQLYPASSSLSIPFRGCVVLETPLPSGEGEYWLNLDHLIKDNDFASVQVLVNSKGTILGGRAVFKGGREGWWGTRGVASRERVLQVFLGGDGPPLSKHLPLAYDGTGFGDMVYTFDESGHVSWRIPQGKYVTDEAEYVRSSEEHRRTCADCKNLSSAPRAVLPIEANRK